MIYRAICINYEFKIWKTEDIKHWEEEQCTNSSTKCTVAEIHLDWTHRKDRYIKLRGILHPEQGLQLQVAFTISILVLRCQITFWSLDTGCMWNAARCMLLGCVGLTDDESMTDDVPWRETMRPEPGPENYWKIPWKMKCSVLRVQCHQQKSFTFDPRESKQVIALHWSRDCVTP